MPPQLTRSSFAAAASPLALIAACAGPSLSETALVHTDELPTFEQAQSDSVLNYEYASASPGAETYDVFRFTAEAGSRVRLHVVSPSDGMVQPLIYVFGPMTENRKAGHWWGGRFEWTAPDAWSSHSQAPTVTFDLTLDQTALEPCPLRHNGGPCTPPDKEFRPPEEQIVPAPAPSNPDYDQTPFDPTLTSLFGPDNLTGTYEVWIGRTDPTPTQTVNFNVTLTCVDGPSHHPNDCRPDCGADGSCPFPESACTEANRFGGPYCSAYRPPDYANVGDLYVQLWTAESIGCHRHRPGFEDGCPITPHRDQGIRFDLDAPWGARLWMAIPDHIDLGEFEFLNLDLSALVPAQYSDATQDPWQGDNTRIVLAKTAGLDLMPLVELAPERVTAAEVSPPGPISNLLPTSAGASLQIEIPLAQEIGLAEQRNQFGVSEDVLVKWKRTIFADDDLSSARWLGIQLDYVYPDDLPALHDKVSLWLHEIWFSNVAEETPLRE